MIEISFQELEEKFSSLQLMKLNKSLSSAKKMQSENEFYKTFKLPELFIEKNKNELRWNFVFKFQKISEELIEKYRPFITDWYTIIVHQTLSENFLKKHIDKFDCHFIAKYQTLSNKFIDEYFGESTWAWKELSEFQCLSVELILKHADKINIDCLQNNKLINQEELKQKEIYTMIKLLQSK